MKDDFAFLKTPIGTAKIIGNNEGISSIKILDKELDTSKNIPDNLKECVLQLKEYFQKKRTDFDLQLNPQGTDFQKKVWNELQQIPYGKTTTYLKQSISLGNAKTIRAVAAANGKNLLWIVIPCHRVIGTNGSLTGYAGGIWRKKWLLEHENPSTQMQLF
jgi:methylated-DNA-[protein]-cysteine S-methyltransferase